MKRQINNRAVTIVELLAIIVILAILATVSTVVIGRVVQNFRQKADIATLSSINAATQIYKLSEIDSTHPLFEGAETDEEKLELLFTLGYLSKYPDTQVETNSYSFHSDSEQWVLISSEGEIIYTPTAEVYFTVNSSTTYRISAYNVEGGLSVVVPAEINGIVITEIGSDSFKSLGITSVILPEGIERVSGNSFHSNQLTSIIFPDSVTRIWHNSFNNNLLTSVTFGSGLTRIEGGAFGNNFLTEVELPLSVTYVGDGAFGYGSNYITTITIGSNVQIANDQSFGIYGKAFRTLYNVNKEAGTYLYINGSWTKQ